MSGYTPRSHLPVPLSFRNTIISELVFKLHTCFFFCCTDDTRGGALEVRDFKKRAKEGESYTLSSVQIAVLLYKKPEVSSDRATWSNPSAYSNTLSLSKKRIYHNSKVKPIICIMAIDEKNAVRCKLNTRWGDYKQFLRCLSGPVGDARNDHVDLSQLGPSLVCYVRLFVLWERCHMVSRYSSLARPEPRVSVWSRWEGTWQPHTTCGLKHTHTRIPCTGLFDTNNHPPAALCWPWAVVLHTSLFIQPNKTQRSSFQGPLLS